MNCFNHLNEPAVALCPDCKKGLCSTCSSQNTIPICVTCNKLRANNEIQKILNEIILTFAVGVILTYIISRRTHFNLIEILSCFYLNSGIIPGWKIINSFFPKMIISVSISASAVLLIKFLISICIGALVLPVRFYKNFNRLNTLIKLKTNYAKTN